MRKYGAYLLLPAAIVFLLSGCAVMAVGGAAAGAGAGAYIYVNGELQGDYPHSFDDVWAACEKTLADMRAVSVEPSKEIGKGTISSVIRDEKVRFAVTYKTTNMTNVSVRVGLLGSRTASQLLHDKIRGNLSKN